MDLKIVAILFTAIEHRVLSSDESSQCCYSRPIECCQYRQPDCLDYKDSGENKSGVYRIIPPDMHTGYEVYCDMETDGGGWMVFQRREDGSVNFFRDWDDYLAGFGNVSHEHWLGFIPLKKLLYSGDYELRIEFEDLQNETRFAKYSIFSINFTEDYTLTVLGYTGTAGWFGEAAVRPEGHGRDRDCISSTTTTERPGWCHGSDVWCSYGLITITPSRKKRKSTSSNQYYDFSCTPRT